MKARVQSDYSLTTLATQFVADSVYGCAIVGDNSTKRREQGFRSRGSKMVVT